MKKMLVKLLLLLIIFVNLFISASLVSSNSDYQVIQLDFYLYDDVGQKALLGSYDYNFTSFGDGLGLDYWDLVKRGNYVFVLPHVPDDSIIRYDIINPDNNISIPRIEAAFDYSNTSLSVFNDPDNLGITWEPFVTRNDSVIYYSYIYGGYSLLINARNPDNQLLFKVEATTSLSNIEYSGGLGEGFTSQRSRYKIYRFVDLSGLMEFLIFDRESFEFQSIITNNLDLNYPHYPIYFQNNSLYVIDQDYSSHLDLYKLNNRDWNKSATITFNSTEYRSRKIYYFFFNNTFVLMEHKLDFNSPLLTLKETDLDTFEEKIIFHQNVDLGFYSYNKSCPRSSSDYSDFHGDFEDTFGDYLRYPYDIIVENDSYALNIGYYILSNKDGQISLHDFTTKINCSQFRIRSIPYDYNHQVTLETNWVLDPYRTSNSVENFQILVFFSSFLLVNTVYLLKRRKK